MRLKVKLCASPRRDGLVPRRDFPLESQRRRRLFAVLNLDDVAPTAGNNTIRPPRLLFPSHYPLSLSLPQSRHLTLSRCLLLAAVRAQSTRCAGPGRSHLVDLVEPARPQCRQRARVQALTDYCDARQRRDRSMALHDGTPRRNEECRCRTAETQRRRDATRQRRCA